MPTTTISEQEAAALRRVERAARKVLRFPGDRQPIQQLFNAIRRLDQTRKEEA